MKKYLLLFLLLVSFSGFVHSQKIVAGYYYSGRDVYPATAIDYKTVTHVMHAFIKPLSNGTLAWDSWFPYPDLIKTAHANGVKVIVALGGYGNSDGFSPMVASASARKTFVDELVKFIKANGYDGADLDWEYPKAADKNNLTLLVTEMREAFNANGIQYITAALPSTDWSGGYDIPALKDKIDWFGIMTYDFSGPWESKAYFNSPLYSQQSGSIDNSVKTYSSKGMPKEKILIGIPFYGYRLTATGPYAAHTVNEGSSVTYPAANNLIAQGWEYNFDDYSKVPYLQDKAHKQFVTYDDTNSVKLKSEYVVKNGIKGTIIWELRHGYTADKVNLLLQMINRYMVNPPTQAPAVPETAYPAQGQVFDTVTINFNWKPSNTATSYSLQVSMDSTFNTLLVVNRPAVTFNSYSGAKLYVGKNYYWRVAAINSAGTSAWSKAGTFRINDNTVDVKDEEKTLSVKPESYELSNYPNPFNPSTKIHYQIPESGHVNIRVYDIIGKDVALLVNDYRSAGSYEVEFDGRGLSSGVYFYQLRAGSHISTRKMVLNK